MQIRSPLTTGDTKGGFKTATGTAFTQVAAAAAGTAARGSGPCGGGRPGDLAELVAIARVPKVSGPWDWLMNALLLLPTDALAVLPCRLRVWAPSSSGGGASGNGAGGDAGSGSGDDEEEAAIVAGLYTTNRCCVHLAHHGLTATWFQPLNP
jgi:hypothetical protein